MTNDAPRSGLGQFLAEIKRRHVVRFSIGYAAAAFVALQLAEIVFPAFGIGEGALRLLVVLVTLGFLPAVVLAWLYDVTAQGIRRTRANPSHGSAPGRVSVVAFAVVALGVTGGVTWYVLDGDVIQSLTSGRTAFDPSQPIRSLAVLPLDDFSQDGDQEYFAAGMHEELIARLSMLEGVRVVSRTSVMRYAGTTMPIPDIGRELGVDVIVEGSVNRAGERVRITLQVIHAASDSHITTLQFDRESADVLSLQTEVAHAVAHEIQGTHAESTFTLAAADVDPVAQEAYFRGKHEYDQGTAQGYQAAVEYFTQALEVDSSFASAMAGLASARFLLGLEDPVSGAGELERAREEAIAALEMDSTSLEVREVLDLIDRNLAALLPVPVTAATSTTAAPPAAGPTESTGASELDSAWTPTITRLGQRIEERMRSALGARDQPGSARQTAEARQLLGVGRYAEASPLLEATVRSTPLASPAWDMLAKAYVGAGDAAAAADAMRRWGESGAPGAPSAQSLERLSAALSEKGDAGYWTWRLETLEAAAAAGREIPRTELAAAHAALGDSELALGLLAEAADRGERGLATLGSDPVWDDLRGEPRFRELERRTQFVRFNPAQSYMRGRSRPNGP